jgi:hypothetical protein
VCGNTTYAGSLFLNELLQGKRKSVRRVLGEQRMLDAHHFAERFGGNFGGQGFGFRADDHGAYGQAVARPTCWPAARASQLMRLMRPARSSTMTRMPLIGRAPRISAFQPAPPRLLWPCREHLRGFLFLRQRDLLQQHDGRGVDAKFRRGQLAHFLVLARLMPISVA